MSKVEEIVEEDEVQKPTTKDQQKQQQALNNMSSSIDEKEATVDTSKAQQMLSSVSSKSTKKTQDMGDMNIKINDNDVSALTSEFEIPRAEAETALRKNKGDLEAAMRYLLVL